MKKSHAVMISFSLMLSSLFSSCSNTAQDTTSYADTTPEVTKEVTAKEVTTFEPLTTAAPEVYYVRTPQQPPEESLKTEVYTYTDYAQACAYADKNSVASLGYAVYGEDGTFLYGKNSEFVTNLLYEAKHIADFMKLKKYTYGNAITNPAQTYKVFLKNGKLSDRVASCDRYVGWVLYRVGYTDQPSSGGMYVWNNGSDHDLGTYLEKKGFEKITKTKDFKAGDIVFVNLTHTSAGTPYPAHVFICAGETDKKNYFYRYDAGSQNRIRCTNVSGMGADYSSYSESGQPFRETITNLVYVYRYTDNG